MIGDVIVYALIFVELSLAVGAQDFQFMRQGADGFDGLFEAHATLQDKVHVEHIFPGFADDGG